MDHHRNPDPEPASQPDATVDPQLIDKLTELLREHGLSDRLARPAAQEALAVFVSELAGDRPDVTSLSSEDLHPDMVELEKLSREIKSGRLFLDLIDAVDRLLQDRDTP